MLKMTELYYFSPTGGTKKAGEMFCKGIAEEVKAIDLCAKNVEMEQPESDLVVIAAPVFAGRIPTVATDKMKELDGQGKKVVTLAVYGNRAYEDALLEMNDVAEEKGFQVIASAALLARHSIVPEVAQGRPDAQDEAEILDFAKKVLAKLESGEEAAVKVPGNHPYKDGMTVSATPISTENCNHCGKCEAVCPTGAIKLEESGVVTNLEKCCLCMACVAACPKQGRILPPPMQAGMNQALGALKEVRRENEFFL